MLDAGQLAQKTRAGRNDQMVVVVALAVIGDHRSAAVGQRGRGGLDEIDLLPVEEASQRKLQVLALHQSGRDPDRAWQIVKLVARRNDGDLRLDVEAVHLPHRGQPGKPSVVTPFITDQFAWARLLYARGLAAAPLLQRTVTADGLAAAIKTALHDNAMRERAKAIGAAVRAEDGLARAVAAIERIPRP